MLGLAHFFRYSNSILIKTHGILHKVFKIVYILSVWVFSRSGSKSEGTRLMLIPNFDGTIKLRVDISKRIGSALYYIGYHEFNELRFLHSFLKPDMTFLDVGANLGEYSLFAAKRLTEGQVFAFEPVQRFYKALQDNIDLNKFDNIKVVPVGLSEKKESMPIYFDYDNATMNEGIATLYKTKPNEPSEIIELDTLDSVLITEKINRVDCIKIDVEGAEWSVLRGAINTLKTFKPVLLIELSDITAERAGYSINQMIDWLSALGYQMHLIEQGKPVRSSQRPAFCNAVFITE